ncbi:MAG: hypothetical protein ACRDVF_17575 [Microbacterium sp.]|uniref:hypothetical protein n=1 Tax=Microbacterium sp. TaxID=51671 RepID=UPI003D6FA57D
MIGVRCFLKRQRYRIVIAAVLGALSVAVALEHSGIDHENVAEAVSMCGLAVLEGAAGLLAAAILTGIAAGRRFPWTLRLTCPSVVAVTTPTTTASLPRPGPLLLQVLRR